MLEMSEDVFYTAVIFSEVPGHCMAAFFLLQWMEVIFFEWELNLLLFSPKFFRLRLFSKEEFFFRLEQLFMLKSIQYTELNQIKKQIKNQRTA